MERRRQDVGQASRGKERDADERRRAENLDESQLTDVSDKAFFYDSVLWAVENGVTNGLSETSFGPGSVCTRAQVVTFLYRSFL